METDVANYRNSGAFSGISCILSSNVRSHESVVLDFVNDRVLDVRRGNIVGISISPLK